jgi:hypothetical protein
MPQALCSAYQWYEGQHTWICQVVRHRLVVMPQALCSYERQHTWICQVVRHRLVVMPQALCSYEGQHTWICQVGRHRLADMPQAQCSRGWTGTKDEQQKQQQPPKMVAALALLTQPPGFPRQQRHNLPEATSAAKQVPPTALLCSPAHLLPVPKGQQSVLTGTNSSKLHTPSSGHPREIAKYCTGSTRNRHMHSAAAAGRQKNSTNHKSRQYHCTGTHHLLHQSHAVPALLEELSTGTIIPHCCSPPHACAPIVKGLHHSCCSGLADWPMGGNSVASPASPLAPAA